ncbi:MAG: Shikimate 5-dehydrogenase alpha, partial [Micavibrio sp.]|nr:Shikimate 5-dehydrogenase alpha [Micavibrio sp.]
VYDIVYRPLLTPLLQQAAGLGLPVVTGLGMLLHQARPAFKGWFNVTPGVDNELQDMVLKAAQ